MENYVWLAIAAGTSLMIFVIWILRGRQGDHAPPGLEEPAGVKIVGGDQPSA